MISMRLLEQSVAGFTVESTFSAPNAPKTGQLSADFWGRKCGACKKCSGFLAPANDKGFFLKMCRTFWVFKKCLKNLAPENEKAFSLKNVPRLLGI